MINVLAIGSDGKPEIQHIAVGEQDRIEQLIPVFCSSLANWRYARKSADRRFLKYAASNLECALLCMNEILATIEKEGTDGDRQELTNFIKSFQNEQVS